MLIPDVNVIRCEAETTLELKGRVLVWSGHLSLPAMQRITSNKYTRELRKDRNLVKTKTWEETILRDLQ